MTPAQMQGLLVMLAVCLLLTVAIECGVAALCGIRAPRGLVILALAQVATNPLVVAVSAMASQLLADQRQRWMALAALELVAVLAEALIYRAGRITRHPLALSAVCNLASFLVGLSLPVRLLLGAVRALGGS